MTDCERMAAQLERIALLLVGIDNRLAVIASSLAPPLYKVSDDGVLTRIAETAQVIPIRTGAPR